MHPPFSFYDKGPIIKKLYNLDDSNCDSPIPKKRGQSQNASRSSMMHGSLGNKFNG